MFINLEFNCIFKIMNNKKENESNYVKCLSQIKEENQVLEKQ